MKKVVATAALASRVASQQMRPVMAVAMAPKPAGSSTHTSLMLAGSHRLTNECRPHAVSCRPG